MGAFDFDMPVALHTFPTEQSQPTASEVTQNEVDCGDSDVNTEMMIKHPLQNQWTLWFFKPDRAKGWEENQREVICFQTVEDF